MDPFQSIPPNQPIPAILPLRGIVPGVTVNFSDGNDVLDKLDSDTRAYVIKHTSESRSKADVINCVNNLRSKS